MATLFPGRLLDMRTFTFAVFMMAGSFKNDPRLGWLPIDLTVLACIGTLLFCAKAFVDRGFKIPSQTHWIVGLFVLLAVPLFWSDLMHAYPLDKVQKLFSLTLIAGIAPFFILEVPEDHRRFLNALALLGLIMTFEATLTLVGGGPMQRLTAFDASTIALGRAAALPLIWGAILALEGHLPWLVALPTMGMAAIILFFSGSRGPFLSAFAILACMGVVYYRGRLKQAMLLVMTFVFLGVALGVSATYAPTTSLGRIDSFLRGDFGNSEMVRVQYVIGSLEMLQRHPLGIGWGGVAIELGSGGSIREYPHNFVLETVVEAGWLAGAWMIAVCLAAWGRITRMASTAEARGTLGILLFLLFNGLVSGDLNDNKLLLCFLGVSLAYGLGEAPRTEAPPDEVEAAVRASAPLQQA